MTTTLSEEQPVIDWVEQAKGRELTPQEIYLSLEQARDIGHI